jgi:hypothetical protein
MSVMLLRQNVKEAKIDDAMAGVRELFAALERAHPEGLHYASTRVAGTSTFVILLELAEGADDPRSLIPEFPRFQEKLANFLDGPPTVEELDVVGSYDLFGFARSGSPLR